MKRKFIISGSQPIDEVNKFMESFGFSEKIVIPFSHTINLTVPDDISQEEIKKQNDAIKSFYEKQGFINFTVSEVI